jgi:hypothetical protein
MFESSLRFRAEEIQDAWLREAAAWRLARQAREGRQSPSSLMVRIRAALTLRRSHHSSDAIASATSRTPSTMSGSATAP